MGARYLCSRTELFRHIDLDIGNRPLFLGADVPFLGWLEKMLPGNSVTVDDIESVPEGILFDRIIIWSEAAKDLGPGESAILSDISGQSCTYWIVHPLGTDNPGKDTWNKPQNGTFPLSTELQITRIELIKDRRSRSNDHDTTRMRTG